jgi:subtilisin
MSPKSVAQQLQSYGEAPVLVVLDASVGRDAVLSSGEHPVLDHLRRAERAPAPVAADAVTSPGGAADSTEPASASPGAGPAATGTPLRLPAVLFPELGVAVGTTDRAGHAALLADESVSEVHHAAELELVTPLDVSDDGSTDAPSAGELAAGMTWAISKLDIATLWAQGLTGKGVGVAHLDTGVDASHVALTGRVVDFAEFDANGKAVSVSGPYDSAFHGTHTAGTICGSSCDGLKLGVAPEATLYACRVIEYPDGALVRTLAGLNWALTIDAVKVVNLSIGVKGYDPFLLAVLDRVRARGVLPVVAIGNEGPNTSRSPGNYTNVLSVGASTIDDDVAFFSGSQTFDRTATPQEPDLLAPGTNILSANSGGGLRSLMGTSQATPHVSGLAALLFQRRPDATPDQIEQAIFDSTVLPSGADPTRFGRGIITPVTAVAKLDGS